MDYSSEVRKRLTETPGAGVLDPALPGRVYGEGRDRALNVWVRFEVQIIDGRVTESRFQAYGCPHTIAAASWVAEWARGRTVDALSRLDVAALMERFDVPTEKLGKLLRVEDALRECARRFDEADSSAGSVSAAK